MKIYALKFLDIGEDELDNLCLLISPDKLDKIKHFRNKQDKIRTLIGEILLRTILIEQVGLENKHLIFEQNQYGKPYLRNYPFINFNLSHSGDFVVCATDVKPLGIDIEEVKDLEYVNIAQNFFTESELNYIFKQSLDTQLSKFYELWTLKESYVKCRGQGLATQLQSFSIEIDQAENIEVVINNKQVKEYSFKKFEIGLNYKMAICSVNREIPHEVIMVEQESLIYHAASLIFE